LLLDSNGIEKGVKIKNLVHVPSQHVFPIYIHSGWQKGGIIAELHLVNDP
jgi:hypothetical protein